MPPRTDILDENERLGGPLLGSVALHIAVVGLAVGSVWMNGRSKAEQWGYATGGGMGSVAVTPVARIPLPSRGGEVNPVANDTESQVPTPKSTTKAQPKVQAPDPSAIEISSRNAKKKPSQAAAQPNKFRDQQQDVPNQVYSSAGQRLSSPLIGRSGAGDVRPGDNTPFGTQFGYYKDILTQRVSQAWQAPMTRTANPVVVTFSIRRDGSVPLNSIQVRQTSGNGMLDLSARRAVQDASPFPPLPAGFNRNEAEIEFWFELRR